MLASPLNGAGALKMADLTVSDKIARHDNGRSYNDGPNVGKRLWFIFHGSYIAPSYLSNFRSPEKL